MLQGVNKLNQGAASSKTFPRSCGVGKEYSQRKRKMQKMQEMAKNAKENPKT